MPIFYYHKQNQAIRLNAQGIILLAMLIFLQIFSLFSLYYLSSAADFIKFNYYYFNHRQNHILAEIVLDQVENQLIQRIPACLIARSTHQSWRQLSLLWWQQYGCIGEMNHRPYYFVVESLGQDPCALLDQISASKLIIADYYRLTLYFPSPLKRQKIILQSTFARGNVSSLSCQATAHHFVMGKQMHRDI